MVLEPPRLRDLPRWEGCFITSTSRLLLPVDEATPMLDAPPASGNDIHGNGAEAPTNGTTAAAAPLPPPRAFARGGLVSRLERLVLAEVEAASEPLFM